MGPGLGHVAPGESCAVRGAGGHRSLGTVLYADASSHTARHDGGGTTQFILPFLSLVLDTMHTSFLMSSCCWQDNAGNRMKGFKYLLLAAESGDRSSMITMARAFDTGINLSADRSVTQSNLFEFQSEKFILYPGPTVMIMLPPGGFIKQSKIVLFFFLYCYITISIIQKAGLGGSHSLV